MTEQENAALVEFCESVISAHIQHGGDSDEEAVYRIALASLTAEPVGDFYEDGKDNWWQLGPHDKVPHVTPLYATPPAPAIADGCVWRWDEHDYQWQAACGGAWLFCDGGPAENEVNFCQKCGGRVIIDEDVEE